MPTNSNSVLHVLHAWENNPIYLKCVQGESGIKIAKFQLVDDDGVIDLTGNTGVVFMGTSGNGGAVSVDCTVDNASTGEISFHASTNFTNAIGNTVGNIVVSFSNNQNIQFDGITIKVSPNKAIEALIHDDTFATFLAALSRLQDIEDGELTTVDSALNTNSTNPVQNSVIADKFNEVDTKFDSYIKAVNANTLDDCTNANYIYRVYISSNSVSSWNAPACYCRVLVIDAQTYLTQYVFSQINWKLAVRYKNKSSGSWSDLKYFAISGDTLAAYGITNAYTKSETYSKTEVDRAINNLTGTVAQNKSNIEQRVAIAEGTVSGHTSAINSLQGAVAQHNTDINSLKSRASALETGMGNVYDKQHSYSKSEIDSKVSAINNAHNSFVSISQAIWENQENDIDTLEAAVSDHASSISTLQSRVNSHNSEIAANTNALIEKMNKNFLSVTSFMCDDNGTIFAATDDTILTNESFENQDKTANPYFIWIANTVTEVENNAFINTGKIVKIYCETKSVDTPLPSNYRSLPIEYGYNALFAFYIMRSLVGLLNDKADKTGVYSAENADNTFEKLSNKVDSIESDFRVNTLDHTTYPTIAALKLLLTTNFYLQSDIDDELDDIRDEVDTKANSQDVYTQAQVREMITALENLCTELGNQIATRIRNENNVIDTNHIKNSAVTEEKLSVNLQAKINKNTAICSHTFLASGWNNKQQTFTLPNSYTVTNNTKVDVEAGDSVIEQLIIDECRGIYVTNNNGTLTINALDNSPTENITVQLVVYEVENIN